MKFLIAGTLTYGDILLFELKNSYFFYLTFRVKISNPKFQILKQVQTHNAVNCHVNKQM